MTADKLKQVLPPAGDFLRPLIQMVLKKAAKGEMPNLPRTARSKGLLGSGNK